MGFFSNLDISALIKSVAGGLNRLGKDASVSEADIYRRATGKNKPTVKSTGAKATTAKPKGVLLSTRRK